MAGGAPVGNTNGAKGYRWRDALIKALERYNSGRVVQGQALHEIAMQVVEKAVVDGDWDCINEIANRLDGKAPQGITLSGDDENPLRFKRVIEYVGKLNGHGDHQAAGETTSAGKTSPL